MDNRPIGFFDSGLGGLTCVPHLMRKLPSEKIIYYGDTARTPYGSKDEKTIIAFAKEITSFLLAKDVKMIVIACNTVSATALTHLRESHPGLPIVGIISPAAHAVASRCNATNSVGVIGTKATIYSKAYRDKIHSYNPSITLRETACPALVPLIEEGIIENEIMDLTLKYYLDHFISYNKIDTLVLGCTHYPFVRENIERLFPHLDIIDPSKEIVVSIIDALKEADAFAKEEIEPRKIDHEFYASDLSENYVAMLNSVFGKANLTIGFALP
jgi:glutamate racemase